MTSDIVMSNPRTGVVTIYVDDEGAGACDAFIRERFADAEVNLLQAAEKLYEARVLKHYIKRGHRTFKEYCATFNRGRSTCYLLAQIHETFILHAQCPTVGLIEAGSSKLRLIAKRINDDDININDKEAIEGWINTASVLTRSDLITELRAAYGDEMGDAVDWRRRAHLWKFTATKYRRLWKFGKESSK